MPARIPIRQEPPKVVPFAQRSDFPHLQSLKEKKKRLEQELDELNKAISNEVLRLHHSLEGIAGRRITEREKEVFDAMATGMSNKQIASKLNVTERTVKFHMSALLAKFGATNRYQLRGFE